LWIRDPILPILVPGSRMGNQDLDQGSGYGKKIFEVKIPKFFDADPDPGIFLTLDPGSEKEKIRIRDKYPGSATLVGREELSFQCCTCTCVFLCRFQVSVSDLKFGNWQGMSLRDEFYLKDKKFMSMDLLALFGLLYKTLIISLYTLVSSNEKVL
jgi:hypothetical protein